MENPTSASPTSKSPEDSLAPLTDLLRTIIRHGGFDLEFKVHHSKPTGEESELPEVVIELSGRDQDLLLEKNATLLEAIEHVVLKALRPDSGLYGKVGFDCSGWRQVRAEEIRLTAQMAAEQVIATGQPFTLNPMTAGERRIAHVALKNHPKVRTLSEGAGRDRHVVIFPAEPIPSKAASR